MRFSAIVACLLLWSSSSALACFEEEAVPAGGSLKMAMPRRGFAEDGAEGSSMSGARLAGVGSASLALIVLAFRALRASGRARSVEVEPAEPVGPSSPARRPGDAWMRIDPGHGRAEPRQAVGDREALSGARAMQ